MSATKWPRKITVGHASVKVYRNAHTDTASGWIYVVAWNSPKGRQRQKFAEETEALKEARAKATQLSAGRVEGASMTTGDRDELQAARKITGKIPVLAALDEWAKARALTFGNVIPAAEAWAARNGQAHKRVTVARAVKEFLKAKTAAGKNVAKDHSGAFKKINEVFGETSIDSVSSRQLDEFLAGWDHPSTRNTIRKRIVSVWRWSQRKGFLPREARTEAEMTDAAHEPAPTIGIISTGTWRALLTYFRAHHSELLPALVLAGFCGLRRSEIHGQIWDDISLERKVLRITTAKRGTPARRMVPLCDAAVAWLMLAPQKTGSICPMVEWDDGPQPSLAVDGIRRIAREATAENKKPKFPALPENCFRHSYITHAVASSGDIPRVSLDAGNSPKEINRHYRELVSEQEGKEWFDSPPADPASIVAIGSENTG